MAPKKATTKRQRGESSRQAPPQATTHNLFHTPQAQERYEKCFLTRVIKKERGLEIDVLEAWNWHHRFLAQPGLAFDSVVREFYANAGDGLNNEVCTVRGVQVSFSAAAINAYYGTANFRFSDDFFHQRLKSGRVTEEELEAMARSFHPEARWNIRNGLHAHMDYEYFSTQDRGILDFIKAKLIPYSNRGWATREQVYILYCIKTQQTIDIGRIINRSICEIANSDKKSWLVLAYPFLISELRQQAGVPIDPSHEVKIAPPPPNSF